MILDNKKIIYQNGVFVYFLKNQKVFRAKLKPRRYKKAGIKRTLKIEPDSILKIESIHFSPALSGEKLARHLQPFGVKIKNPPKKQEEVKK